ncbi:MAG: hypothetical protein MUP69_02155 [Candidatus Atribacteria bacterium]|nr:hypothetical protein [Candidatus Atribacteria bacterium]
MNILAFSDARTLVVSEDSLECNVETAFYANGSRLGWGRIFGGAKKLIIDD